MDVTEDRRRNSKKALDPFSAKILRAILADVERHSHFADLDDEWAGPMVVDFRRRGVRYSPRLWFGKESVALRQACSRVIRRMARDGVLERVTEPGRDRVRFVRLTANGIRLALLDAGDHCDAAAVVQGLSQTDWGKDLQHASSI